MLVNSLAAHTVMHRACRRHVAASVLTWCTTWLAGGAGQGQDAVPGLHAASGAAFRDVVRPGWCQRQHAAPVQRAVVPRPHQVSQGGARPGEGGTNPRATLHKLSQLLPLKRCQVHPVCGCDEPP